MAATIAALATTHPPAVGNSGVAPSVDTEAHTNSNCVSRAQVGQTAGPTHGAPPGSMPRKH
eukprot:4028454-Alexandrium_andersonii.AAC.1